MPVINQTFDLQVKRLFPAALVSSRLFTSVAMSKRSCGLPCTVAVGPCILKSMCPLHQGFTAPSDSMRRPKLPFPASQLTARGSTLHCMRFSYIAQLQGAGPLSIRPLGCAAPNFSRPYQTLLSTLSILASVCTTASSYSLLHLPGFYCPLKVWPAPWIAQKQILVLHELAAP